MTEDFGSVKTVDGNTIIANKIPGYSLVLFYSPSCELCSKVALPIFKQLPMEMSGCQFGAVNISANKKLIEASAGTGLPLKYVPFIVFYNQGKPIMTYPPDAPIDVGNIGQFAFEMAKQISNSAKDKKKFIEENSVKVPGQTVRQFIPLKGDAKYQNQLCYLTSDGTCRFRAKMQ